MKPAPAHTKYQPKTLLGTVIEILWDMPRGTFATNQEARQHVKDTYNFTDQEARHAVMFGPDWDNEE